MAEVDAVLVEIGVGWYQVIIWLAIATANCFPSAWHILVTSFTAESLTHHCAIPTNASLNESIPLVNGAYDPCRVFVPGTVNSTEQCSSASNQWVYNRSVDIESTIVDEWDLVCESNFLPELSTLIFAAGIMAGAAIFGITSDRYGRKVTMFACILAQSVVGVATAFSPNFTIFIIPRFIVGALEQGVNISGFILATELFPPKQRSIYAVAHEFLWAIGCMLLPVMAYMFRTWKSLQLAVSVPGFAFMLLYPLIPESVPWLVSRNRYDEAERILERIAGHNRTELPPRCLRRMTVEMEEEDIEQEHEESLRTYTQIDLFKGRTMCLITICVSIMWFVNTLVYYGIQYNTPNLPGDRYVNFFLSSFIEVPSVAITVMLLYWVGRRIPLFVLHVIAGFATILVPFIPALADEGTDLSWLVQTVALVAKFSINSSFTIVYVYGAELFPTITRNLGVGFGSMWGRIGFMLYSPIKYLEKSPDEFTRTYMPMIIFGMLSFVGAFTALPVPETRNNPLPKTIEHVNHYAQYCAAERLLAESAKENKKERRAGDGAEMDKMTNGDGTPLPENDFAIAFN